MFANFSDMKLERALKKNTVKDTPPSILHTPSTGQAKSVEPTCFFCEEPAGSTILDQASTFDIDLRVRKCAHELQDTKILAKLTPGDSNRGKISY